MRRPFGKPAGIWRDNRGSGLVTVLVTMLFVSVLGATLLFTSYTGYLIKVSERGGKESFYSAGTAMDEIKIAIQQAVNESLSEAYTRVLSEYITLVERGDEELQKSFADEFYDAIEDWGVKDGDVTHSLFDSDGTYNTAALRCLPRSAPAGSKVEVTGDGDGTVARNYDADGKLSEIVLEGIRVDYVSPEGYASAVSTDISITMPDFYATTTTVTSSALPTYALVANGELRVSGVDRSLSGSAYAGDVNLNTSGSRLAYESGTLVCEGVVSVENSAEFRAGAGTELWAGNITLGTGGAARLYGRTYVRDDLTLGGDRAAAELKGSYCGFGDGSGDGDEAGKSSAVVINGRNTSFDVDSLDRLILAGVSFVDFTGSGAGGSIRTGESVSVKINQLAYLVDGSCLTVNGAAGRNPYLYGDENPSFSVDLNKVLWVTAAGEEKTLRSYGVSYNEATRSYTGITPVFSGIHKDEDGNYQYKLAYFFLNFSSQATANQYFRDFFTYRPDRIEEYIHQYTALSGKARSVSAAGNTLYTEDGELTLGGAGSFNVAGLAAQFANRCQTLSPGKASPGDTPYTFFVKEEAIAPGDNLAFELEGSIAARVIGGNYTISGGEEAKLIIATGDVTVNGGFDGLILAGGNIVQYADIFADPQEVQNILANMESAVAGGGELLTDYLDNTQIQGSGSGTIHTSWDLDILVSYRNWAKH